MYALYTKYTCCKSTPVYNHGKPGSALIDFGPSNEVSTSFTLSGFSNERGQTGISWKGNTKSCLLRCEKLSVLTHEPRDSCKMGKSLSSGRLPCNPVLSVGTHLAGATPCLNRHLAHRDWQHAAIRTLHVGI